MESGDMTERRRHPRFGLEFDVQMRTLDLDERGEGRPKNHTGVSRDVSETGIRVWASQAYPIQSMLLLTFECPEMGWNNITSRVGLVVWAEDLRTEGRCLLGIRFTEDGSSGRAQAA